MKFLPYKILEIELTKGIREISGLDDYGYGKILLKYFGEPIGFVTIPVYKGEISSESIHKSLSKYAIKIFELGLRWNLLQAKNISISLDEVLRAKPPLSPKELYITVAVCSRNRTSDLDLCLKSIKKLKYSNYEVVIVDNAPDDNTTELLAKNDYPEFRYIKEPIPGLDNARNRAIIESKGEIIAYTDDDVIVDELWLSALSKRFQESEDICAVTGLVVAYEMETKAQFLFEQYGGFGRGFERVYALAEPSLKKTAFEFAGSGKYGTGANMAYRKSIFDKIGLFDPALDVGTPANGGGDLEMFFRVIKEGYTLVYEPCAVVKHRHRREYSKLKIQLANNGIGFYSHLVRTYLHYKEERFQVLKLGVYWLFVWNIKRFLISMIRPNKFPRALILSELIGSFKGLFRYFKSKKKAQTQFEKLTTKSFPEKGNSKGIYVTEVEITNSPISFPASKDYALSRFYLLYNKKLIGSVDINNRHKEINRERLIYEAASKLNIKFLDIYDDYNSEDVLWGLALKKIKDGFKPVVQEMPVSIEKPFTSIVIATLDRPEDLKECIISLKQAVKRSNVEIIIVDNNPSSGLTSNALKGFEDIILLNETRKGLSYARNKGFLKAKGEISVALDDDVIVPEDWLENLLEPFRDPAVAAVTGNVLPNSLDLEPQNLFEDYGGLGKGFKRKEAGTSWFQMYRYKAVPTWTLGATANAAFRTSIFHNKEIGLLHEALGAGTPCGCSEDTYLFYKILKAGFNIVYNPNAYVRHKHRATLKAFKRQLYNYSKGHVGYNLLTVFKDDDYRGLTRIFVELPLAHLYRIYSRIRRRSPYPIKYVFLEILGNLAGPIALIRSLARLKKLNKKNNNEVYVHQEYAEEDVFIEFQISELQAGPEFNKENLQNIN